MAIIQSGAGVSLLTVDPVSLGARVILYGPDGEPLVYKSNRDRGVAQIAVVQSATTAAAANTWSLRNAAAAYTLYISRIWLQLFQSGTGAATEMQYELVKATGVTSQSGGAVVTPLLKRTAANNPDVDCRVLDTGLTLNGASYGSAFYRVAWSRLTHSATQAGAAMNPIVLEFENKPIELAQNEALVLRQVVTSVVGDSVFGGCEFYGG